MHATGLLSQRLRDKNSAVWVDTPSSVSFILCVHIYFCKLSIKPFRSNSCFTVLLSAIQEESVVTRWPTYHRRSQLIVLSRLSCPEFWPTSKTTTLGMKDPISRCKIWGNWYGCWNVHRGPSYSRPVQFPRCTSVQLLFKNLHFGLRLDPSFSTDTQAELCVLRIAAVSSSKATNCTSVIQRKAVFPVLTPSQTSKLE